VEFRKIVRPSASHQLQLPEHIRDEIDAAISSFWIDDEPLLLQLSSRIQTASPQIAADA
jgi:hypothetical protein